MTNVEKALEYASRYGDIDGAHHKMWVIDQMVRALTNCPTVTKTTVHNNREFEWEDQGESKEYNEWVARHCDGDDGPETYYWETGIAP